MNAPVLQTTVTHVTDYLRCSPCYIGDTIFQQDYYTDFLTSVTTGQNKVTEQRFVGFLHAKNGSLGIVVGTVTKQQAGQSGIRFPAKSRKFSSTMSRPALEPT